MNEAPLRTHFPVICCLFCEPVTLIETASAAFLLAFSKGNLHNVEGNAEASFSKTGASNLHFFPHLILYLCILLFCQFFVEEPGGTREDAFTTGPPEVLLLTSDTNVTNETSPDTLEGSSRGDKFYLPVGLTIVVSLCCFRSTAVKLLH